jgi:hypothetical protein
MFALTMTTSDLGLLSPRDATSFKSTRFHVRVLVRFSVALITLTALIAPDCCLTRSHAHGGYLDWFGPICFSRAVR